MNRIDGVEVKTFRDPFTMASWLKDNVPNELRQEQLMFQGIQHKEVTGIYQFTVELSAQQLWEIDNGVV